LTLGVEDETLAAKAEIDHAIVKPALAFAADPIN
jgi:hypothetical protein